MKPQIKYLDPQGREVLAIQWRGHGDHFAVKREGMRNMSSLQGCINTLDYGLTLVRPGDYIVTSAKGDYKVVSPSSFNISYTPIEE